MLTHHVLFLFTPQFSLVLTDSWPMQPDILSPPLLRLTSRNPLWLDLQPVDIKSRWRHNWKSAQVVDSHLVCDPTIRQPGFDHSRQQWSLLNHFRTEQGHCGACRRMKTLFRGWQLWLKKRIREEEEEEEVTASTHYCQSSVFVKMALSIFSETPGVIDIVQLCMWNFLRTSGSCKV